MCIFPLLASAQGSVIVDGLKYTFASDQTAQVVGCDAALVDMVIPSTVSHEGNIYSVTGIADEAFNNKASLKTVVISASVESLGLSSFESCKNLSSVSFEEGSRLAVISSSAFASCIKLRNVNFAKECSLTTIANSAFTGCSNLMDIKFPASLKNICFYAFGECTSLGKVSFDDNAQITEIEPFAFNSCSSLTTLEIPASMKSLGDMSFSSCNSLKTINCAIMEPFKIGDVFDYGKNQTLYVPKGCKAKYQEVSGWKRFKNIEENETLGIDDIAVEDVKDGAVYDLQGNRVTNPVKGIYIKNGKKVIL